MPMKRGEAKGDLYLIVDIEFPEDGWLENDAAYDSLTKMLPGPQPPIEAEEVDEVDYDSDADLDKVSSSLEHI